MINSLSILRKVQFNFTASEGCHKLDFTEAFEQSGCFTLELLFEDDGLAVDLHAEDFAAVFR